MAKTQQTVFVLRAMSDLPKRSASADLGTALFVRAISVDDEEEANADTYNQDEWEEGYAYEYDGFDAVDEYAENYTMGQGLRVGGGGGGGRKSKKKNISNTIFSSKHVRQVEARTSAGNKSKNGKKSGPVSSTSKAKKKNKARKLRNTKKL